MNLNKNGGVVNKIRVMVMAGIVATLVTIPTVELVDRHVTIEQEHTQSYNKDVELRKEYRLAREAEDKQYEEMAKAQYEKVKEEQEEKERMKNYTYRTIKELKQKTGLNVVGFQEHTFELSFYSDLNCENGYGNLTANGERLSAGMVANNFLPFNTKVYIEGFGTKRVTDRGSKKYFTNVTKFDVFVPRNGGESDDAYYRRVNNMGRKHIKGYILKVGR